MDNYNVILFLRWEAIVFEYALCNFKIFPMSEQKSGRENSLVNNAAPLHFNLGTEKSPILLLWMTKTPHLKGG